MTWTAVLPLKPLAAAKSRLRAAGNGIAHEELVLRLASATVSAIAKTPDVGRIVVVTADPAVRETLCLAGAEIVDDPGGGLNGALRSAAATISGPVAALPADLGALRPEELAEALAEGAAHERFFVADALATGTVLLAATRGDRLDPRFGPGSAAAHAASGAVELRGAWPTLRHDIDTVADLERARRLGLRL